MRLKDNILLTLFSIMLTSGYMFSQSIEAQIEAKLTEKAKILESLKAVENEIIDLKMAGSIEHLKQVGLPSDNYIEHSAMILEYDEKHEQARWVSHMILPEIKNGKVLRTNDFRIDKKVKTGTATQQDYFLTDTLENGKVNYDGYGYDRGHLAASADFRWSEKALSESYYYSNMSPQLPDFNREIWADLEGLLRKYVVANDVPLYVTTLPILTDDLPKQERAINKLSIPRAYAKVAYDPINERSIGFILENKPATKTLDKYAISINEVEEATGMDFFKSISESTEDKVELEAWFSNIAAGDVDPLYQPSLPPDHFNSVVGGKKIGSKAIVCGKVVSTRFSRKGNLWMNLDKNYPNGIFNLFIREEHIPNFEYDIVTMYKDKYVCVDGLVQFLSDNPTINLKNDRSIKFYDPE